MKAKDQPPYSAASDLASIGELIRLRKLDRALSRLDPDNILSSLANAPREIVRCLMAFERPELREQVVTHCDPATSEVIKGLLESVQRHPNVKEFIARLLVQAQTDRLVWQKLGMGDVYQQAVTDTDATLTLNNGVRRVTGTPLTPLKTGQVYCEIGFWGPQAENLLFRSSFDIVALIAVTGALADHAGQTLKLASEVIAGNKLNIDINGCEQRITQLENSVANLRITMDLLRNKESKATPDS
ncbi:MAG: hypothetical protein ACYDH9_11790 [Limisphaerales bacterium]